MQFSVAHAYSHPKENNTYLIFIIANKALSMVTCACSQFYL